ncbi:hypothetical protein L7F22_063977 [Adiantum nelumboides]|nr:hypothetical protein [Adiantum nelumboides]
MLNGTARALSPSAGFAHRPATGHPGQNSVHQQKPHCAPGFRRLSEAEWDQEEDVADSSDPSALFKIHSVRGTRAQRERLDSRDGRIKRRPKRGPHHNLMRHILVELSNHQAAWPFTNPVNAQEVADYYDFIKEPMDLSTMESKLEKNQYATLDDLLHDAPSHLQQLSPVQPPHVRLCKVSKSAGKVCQGLAQRMEAAGGHLVRKSRRCVYMYTKQWRCTLHGTALDLLVLLVGVCQAGEERLLDASLNLVLVAGRLIGVFVSALDSLCQLQLALAQLEDLLL